MENDDHPKKFSVGFAIDLDLLEVALIRKLRGPSFIIGKLNGCGGHMKLGESPVGGIRREAFEELGLWLPESGQWQQFQAERRCSNGYGLWFFAANVQDLRKKVKTKTDERVEIVSIPEMLQEMAGYGKYGSGDQIENLGSNGSKYVYNLGYLIPMAVSWLRNPEHHYTGL